MRKIYFLLVFSFISLGSMVKADDNLVFLKTFGNAGTGNGEFHFALTSYIMHDNTNIYIVDSQNSRIQKFDIDGNFIAWFGYQELSTEGTVVDGLYVNNFGWYTTGTPDSKFQVDWPVGDLKIDSSGNIYILANGYDVWKFDSNGNFLRKINFGNYNPYIFAIDNAGSIFIQTSYFDYAKYDEDGNELLTFGGFGTDDGEFSGEGSWTRMHSDTSANVYIVDKGLERVQVFNNSGTFLRKWNAVAVTGWHDTSLENNKYYTKPGNTLYEYDLYGNLLNEYNIPEYERGGDERFLVFGKRLFIVDTHRHWVNIFKFSDNELPIANAGPDQTVFDSVTLDGSASSDSDGTITSWEWTLTHRTNPAFNKTATGSNPTITNLSTGFYDVVLTVTDDAGDTDTDTMLLGVAGTWDVNGDGVIGLEEAIHALQVVSGVRSE